MDKLEMPTYDYHCPDCGHKFEKFQSMTSARIKECPKCHKKKVHRLIGAGAGLIFKGSGFYITDYRSEGYKEKAKADSGPTETKTADSAPKDAKAPAKSDAPAPAASKSEAKPAKKSEPKAPAKKHS
jgi:putative FmdB family regulatory protein